MQLKPIVLGSLAAVFFNGLVRAQSAECRNCDAKFFLTRTQVLCVAKRIDRLLDRPGDPVYFDAAGCELKPAVMIAVTPTIKDPPAAPVATAKWLQLSKVQLRCLQTKLAPLQASSSDPVEIALNDSDCAGSR